jgi:hypothetical protein
MLVGQAPVADQLPFARRREHMNSPIDPQDLPRSGQRLRGAFALHARIPPAVLLHDPCSAAFGGNLTSRAQPHRANPRNPDTRAHQTQRSIAVRERQLLPARG